MKFLAFRRIFLVAFTVLMILALPKVFNTDVNTAESVVGPYEVIVYAARDYVGDSKSYKVNIRTDRIKLVNRFPANLDNKVSSIHVGSRVFAVLFDHHDFHASFGSDGNLFTGLFKSVKSIGKKVVITPLGPIPRRPEKGKSHSGASIGSAMAVVGHKNVGVYKSSTPMVQHNDIYTSMLVIPKDLDFAWGVAFYNFDDKFIRIEPIPDKKKYKSRIIPNFGSYLNDKISRVVLLGENIKNTKVTLYEHINYRGKSITLPGAGSDKVAFDLGAYGFDRMTSSIKLKVTPPETDTKRVAAPPADSGAAQKVIVAEPFIVPGVMAEAVSPEQIKEAKQKPQPKKTTPPPPEKHKEGEHDMHGGEHEDRDMEEHHGEEWEGEHHEGEEHEGHHEEEWREEEHGEDEWREEEHHGEEYGEREEEEWREEERREHHEELPPGVANLMGRWRDSQGNFYEIIQHGKAFIMVCEQRDAHKAGLFVGNDQIAVLWHDRGAAKKMTGKIQEKSPEGIALVITLSNGVKLRRE